MVAKNLAAWLLIVGGLVPWPARAQTTYTDLHDFGGQVTLPDGTTGMDGFASQAAVTFDNAGNMFGTTTAAGTTGWGIVWEITSGGLYLVLHVFGGTITNADGTTGRDGEYLDGAGVTIDASGNLYGTTRQGGPNNNASIDDTAGDGMIWEITSSGRYIDLHDFGGTITYADGTRGIDGCLPDSAGVTIDAGGNLYGTTTLGGEYGQKNNPKGKGMVWEISVWGGYKDLHDFGGTAVRADGSSGPDGSICIAPVSFDSSGNMYGTTLEGGLNTTGILGNGVVWQINTSGGYTVLHDFGAGTDGAGPYAGVTIDTAGNLYGTTIGGGANQNANGYGGMIWEITQAGVYEDLHDFAGTTTTSIGKTGHDGAGPYYGGVKIDSVGNLYGTAQEGGAYFSVSDTGSTTNYGGIVWEITKAGVYRDLYDFGGTVTHADGTVGDDGQLPLNTVSFDSAGNLYGTTDFAGENVGASGVVWKLETITELAKVTLTSNVAVGGTATTGTLTLGTKASVGGTLVELKSNSPDAKVPATVTVPAGSTTATFTITTLPVTANASATITAKQGSAARVATLSIRAALIAECTVSPNPVRGGAKSTGTVTLTGPAPAGGIKFTLASSDASYVGVPASITVEAGKTMATFTATTKAYTAGYSSRITVSNAKGSKTATLDVVDDSVTGLTISPSSVLGGTPVTAKVSLHGAAPAGGWVVKLVSSDPSYVGVPSTVTVAAGATSAMFTLKTKAATASYGAKITASDALSSKVVTVNVLDDSVAGFTISPNTVVEGTSSVGTVTLHAAAPAGGWVVNLASANSSIVGVPTLVKVAAGATTATFKITTKTVTATRAVSITASDALSKKSASITVKK